MERLDFQHCPEVRWPPVLGQWSLHKEWEVPPCQELPHSGLSGGQAMSLSVCSM
jgi:hypothetical protein